MTSEKKLMLDAMDIYPTSEEIKDLTAEDLLYLYDRMDTYDDAVVPAMIAMADMEDQYEQITDPGAIDNFMDDVCNILRGITPHCWILEDDNDAYGDPAMFVYLWGRTYDLDDRPSHRDDEEICIITYDSISADPDDDDAWWDEVNDRIRQAGYEPIYIDGFAPSYDMSLRELD